MSKKIKLLIPTIKCAGCVSSVEKALKDESGVLSVQVDLESKSAVVDAEISTADVISKIKTAGYDATEITAN